MPEPFKNYFNPQIIRQMATHLHRVNPNFDQARFEKLAIGGLEKLELKERSNHIRDALTATLGEQFREACETFKAALHPIEDAELGDMSMDENGIRGWAIMPMADFVATHGLEDIDHSLDMLAELTKRFSAEFAIRHLFLANEEKTLKKAMVWTKDTNVHVRRLASEGSRPRLPWGLQLTQFVTDPSPLQPLLENLKDDDSEYVRRSVANNLNDIAKDHPDLVATTAENWLKGATLDQQRMVKHACRSLIKQGHQPTLKALGFGTPKIELHSFDVLTPTVKMGNALEFKIELSSSSNSAQPLIIDFIIHHRKANGSTSPKTFKWKIVELQPDKTLKLKKRHSMKPVTTRVYYEGQHSVEIQINGKCIGRTDFDLVL